MLAEAGKTKLINLKIDGEKRARSVIVREVEVELPRRGLVHVDFYQVRKAEEMKVEVPVVLVGEAPALKLRENTLLQELDTLSVECLPTKIPASVELDISSLTESDQVLRVKDIELEKGVTVLNDPEVVVAMISVRRVEEVVEEAVEAPEEAPPPEEEPKEE